MTERVERLRASPGMVFQVAVQAVHGVRAQEVGPWRGRQPDSALDQQVVALPRLAVPQPEQAPPSAEPPCGLRPHASASSSTTVDFPEPFSPTSTVRPGSSSSPSHSSCSTAGTVPGQQEVSTGSPGSQATCRIERVVRLPSRAAPTDHGSIMPRGTVSAARPGPPR